MQNIENGQIFEKAANPGAFLPGPLFRPLLLLPSHLAIFSQFDLHFVLFAADLNNKIWQIIFTEGPPLKVKVKGQK